MTDIRVMCDYNDENLPPFGNRHTLVTEESEQELDTSPDEEYPFVVKFEHRAAAILAVLLATGVLTWLRASAKIGKKLLS